MSDRLGIQPRVAVPLDQAALCLESHCQAIFSQRDYRGCPSCASLLWVPVTQFIGIVPESGYMVEKIERLLVDN